MNLARPPPNICHVSTSKNAAPRHQQNANRWISSPDFKGRRITNWQNIFLILLEICFTRRPFHVPTVKSQKRNRYSPRWVTPPLLPRSSRRPPPFLLVTVASSLLPRLRLLYLFSHAAATSPFAIQTLPRIRQSPPEPTPCHHHHTRTGEVDGGSPRPPTPSRSPVSPSPVRLPLIPPLQLQCSISLHSFLTPSACS